MKRDSSDVKWQEVKKKVQKRDENSCRLKRILTPTEYFLLKKKAGVYLSIIDPAHFISVSERPDLCYIPENIVCLNRYSHEQLDDYKDPITGKPISAEEHRTHCSPAKPPTASALSATN